MRVTFSPGPGGPALDLELAVGVTLGSLRGRLAAATACPAAARGTLAVGAATLDDSHLTGTFPLVAGARLSVGAEPCADDGVFAAVRADRHLAVVAGQDAGLLVPVPQRLVVGRGAADADLVVADRLVSARHLEVRRAVGRVWVRDVGSANGTRRARRWARHRVVAPVPRWWSRWRDGDRVTIGATELELRVAVTRAPRSRGQKVLVAVAALGPAVGSLALAAGTGNPALLVLGMVGPALATVLHRATPPPTASPDGDDESPSASGAPDAAELTAQVARAVLTGRPAPIDATLEELAPTGTLAVCGPGAREVAATLVLAAAPSRIDVRGPGRAHWTWAHWLASARPTSGDPATAVVVVDGVEPLPGWGAPGSVVVLVDPDRVPSWCSARLDAATGRWSGPDGERTCAVRPGGPAWAERQARLFAGARSIQEAGEGGLPEAVTLGELDLPLQPEAITGLWRVADAGLRAVLGAGPGGRGVVVDLAREGPHALVAGTTGSGKSEALRALVASLALRYPPTALAFALVDFKGGAGFGALTGLPHVVGTVTDLDAHEAARAIGGLAAELRARKELLARVGVTDLRDWPSDADEAYPGRLVVVVDEFRALAEELPDLMGALVRVATQGRSLGVHLVLATQRPSGVVSAELRANVALRLALRVTDAADSSDVIDVADAATIPPSLPGRALLRRGPGPIEEVQVALVGAGTPPVRVVSTDLSRTPADDGDSPASAAAAPPAPSAAPFSPDAPDGSEEPDALLVAAIADAAGAWRPDAPRPTAPWLPALPDLLALDDLHAAQHGAAGATMPPRPHDAVSTAAVPIALADEPERQSRAVVAWEPGAGHLLAIGGPGSGRSTLLGTIGAAALARGWAVHTVGLPESALTPGAGLDLGIAMDPGSAVIPDAALTPGNAPTPYPGIGTVCSPDDPRRLARLITLLAAGSERTLLLIDGIEAAWQSLEAVGRGEGTVRLVELLRARRVGVAMTASGSTGPWASHATERLVLPVGDATADELAGVPRALSGGRRGPGRAIWVPARGEARVCQIALDVGGRATSSHPAVSPVRLAPVPLTATRPVVTTSRRRRLVVGVGGDGATALGLDPRLGGIVVGPPGSGRSNALAHLVLSAGGLGLHPVTIARDGPVLAAAAAWDGGVEFDRDAVLEALERREPEAAVVVDDLDALGRLLPDVTDALDDLVDEGVPVFATLTTTAALGAYRGAVSTLRARREGLVLGAHTPGSDEVFGTPLAWHVDVARPTHPGRGVLQRGSRLAPVQVFTPPL